MTRCECGHGAALHPERVMGRRATSRGRCVACVRCTGYRPELRRRLTEFADACVDSGDMTPTARRRLLAILGEMR